MSENSWDFDNMSIEELRDDMVHTIERYTAMAIHYGARVAINNMKNQEQHDGE